jgi:lipopolysaccharide/colanic/teichoic acid biosynthesis glycosyltransferase
MWAETVVAATWISLSLSSLTLIMFTWATTGKAKNQWLKPGRGNAILRELISPPPNVPYYYHGESGLWHRRYLYARKLIADWPASVIASVSLVTLVIAGIALTLGCFFLPKTLEAWIPLFVPLGTLVCLCDVLVFMYIRGQTELQPSLGTQSADADNTHTEHETSDAFPELRNVSADTAPTLLRHLARHPEAASRAVLKALGWGDSDESPGPVPGEGEADKAYELVLEMALQPPIQSRAAALQWHIANALDPRASVDGGAGPQRRGLSLRLADAVRQFGPARRRRLAFVVDFFVAGFLLLLSLPFIGILIWMCARSSGSQKRGILVGQQCGLSAEEFLCFRLNVTNVGDRDDGESLSAFGKFLAWTGLDRLPALTGVLRGEYSLIGPIPLPAGYVFALVLLAVRTGGMGKDKARRLALARLRVRPGLFGVSQACSMLIPGEMNCLDYAKIDSRYPEWNPFSDSLMRISLFIAWPFALVWRIFFFTLNMLLRDPNQSGERERPTQWISRMIKKARSLFPKPFLWRRRGEAVLFDDQASIFFGHPRF